jgi:hypothetical protein
MYSTVLIRSIFRISIDCIRCFTLFTLVKQKKNIYPITISPFFFFFLPLNLNHHYHQLILVDQNSIKQQIELSNQSLILSFTSIGFVPD